MNTEVVPTPPKTLVFKVLGRTLEHFGVQMYKRREVAIAELVANCWDAGATEVFVEVPTPDAYDQSSSKITIRDSGCGMSFEDVQDDYLVLGRNRRLDTGAETQTILPLGIDLVEEAPASPKKAPTRRVMGRKGIGKLAGFGLAQKMTVTTWQNDQGMEFHLDLKQLKLDDNDAQDIPINWKPVKGRLDILDKFEHMLCNDAPETASKRNPSNMHDLLGGNLNETTELRLMQVFRTNGITGWRRGRVIRGQKTEDRRLRKPFSVRPDFVFPKLKTAVFVDGCFWHGCPKHATWPKNRAAFWAAKLTGNKLRDRRTNHRLRALGWRVVRVWEHELRRRDEARLLHKLRLHLCPRRPQATCCVHPSARLQG